jgi:hypothetical protein
MRPVVVGLSVLALFIVILRAGRADRSPAAQRNEILGAWRSDEARTVEGLRAMGNRLTEAQRKVFLRSRFFGQLILVYREKDVITVYEGECKPPTPYQIVRRDENMIEIRLSTDDKIETKILWLDGDSYSVALPTVKDGREFFKRLPVATVTNEHTCLRKLLAK